MRSKKIIAIILTLVLSLQVITIAPTMVSAESNTVSGIFNDEGLWLTEVYITDQSRNTPSPGNGYEQITTYNTTEELMEFIEIASTYKDTVILNEFEVYYNNEKLNITNIDNDTEIGAGECIVIWNYRSDITGVTLPTLEEFKSEMKIPESTKVLKAETGAEWDDDVSSFEIKKDDVVISAYATGDDKYNEEIGYSVELKVPDIGSEMDVYHRYSIPSPGTIDVSAGHYDSTTKTFYKSQLNGIKFVKDCTEEPSGVFITEIKAKNNADTVANYIEIYNTTDKAVDLNSDYCVKYFRREALREKLTIYDTVSDTADLSMSSDTAKCTVPAGGIAILMCCKKASTTVVDNPTVPEGVPVYYFKLTCYDGELGDAKRGVEVYKINEDETETLVSCYSYTTKDAWDNSANAIHLRPNHDRPNMIWVSGTDTTPGTLKNAQITFDDDGGKLKVTLDDNDSDYNDTITVPKSVMQGDDLRVLFKTTAPYPSKLKRTRTELYFRTGTENDGTITWGSWKSEFENHSGDAFTRVPEYYEAIITADKLLEADAVQFYIKAYNKYRATLSEVYQVEVTKPTISTDKIRTNISEGDYINGNYAIIANTGDSESNSKIKFKFDETNDLVTPTPMMEDGAYLTFTLSRRDDSGKHTLTDASKNVIKDLSNWYGMNPDGQAVKIDSSYFTYNETNKTFDTTLCFWAGTGSMRYNDIDTTNKTITGTNYTLDNNLMKPAVNTNLYNSAIDWYTVNNLKLKFNGNSYACTSPVYGDNNTAIEYNEDVTTSFNVGASKNTSSAEGTRSSDRACVKVSFSILAVNFTTAVGITPTLSDGTHTLYIYEDDNAEASKTISFTVDNSAPVINMGITSDATLTGNIELNPTITDTENNLESKVVFLDGEIIDTPYKTTASELGEGYHQLEVYAIDKAGNQSTKSVGFTVNTAESDDTITSTEADITSGGATLNVNLKGDTDNKTVDFYVTETTLADANTESWTGTGRPENYDFAIAWQTDPQYYAEKYPEIYYGMNNWIVDHAEDWKIKYVINTGDVIDDLDMTYQWEIADKAMKIFDDAGMPYGVLAGNHDVAGGLNLTDSYQKYFGKNRFKNQPTYGGSYKNNLGHYDIISQNGEEFLILYMSWNIYKDELDWMNKILEKHSDKKAILCFHTYTLPDAGSSTTIYIDTIGKLIEQNVVAKNENVIAVLNGHYYGSAYYIREYDDDGDGTNDRKVYSIAKDYQSGINNGDGYIDLLYFNLSDKKVYINSYWTMAPKGTSEADKFNFFANHETDTEKKNTNVLYDLSNATHGAYQKWVDAMTFNFAKTETPTITASNLKSYIGSSIKVNDESVSFDSTGNASAKVNYLEDETTYNWFAVVTDNETGNKQIVQFDNYFTTRARNTWGDADNSGEVTIKDVTAIQLHLVWKKRLSDKAVTWSKVNGNSNLDIRDATTIQMKLAQLIDKFPVEQ